MFRLPHLPISPPSLPFCPLHSATSAALADLCHLVLMGHIRLCCPSCSWWFPYGGLGRMGWPHVANSCLIKARNTLPAAEARRWQRSHWVAEHRATGASEHKTARWLRLGFTRQQLWGFLQSQGCHTWWSRWAAVWQAAPEAQGLDRGESSHNNRWKRGGRMMSCFTRSPSDRNSAHNCGHNSRTTCTFEIGIFNWRHSALSSTFLLEMATLEAMATLAASSQHSL